MIQFTTKRTSLKKIISGGQTGADRAALDAALACHFELGGYCPKGRTAEDGVIEPKYLLTEIDGGTAERTLKNVLASDLTVLFYKSLLSGGTKQTLTFCTENKKPYQLIDSATTDPNEATHLLAEAIDLLGVKVLNVAGPRLSECPDIYLFVHSVILKLLQAPCGK